MRSFYHTDKFILSRRSNGLTWGHEFVTNEEGNVKLDLRKKKLSRLWQEPFCSRHVEPRREHRAPKWGSRIWPNRKRRRTLARIRFWVRWAISTVSAYRPVMHFLEILASLQRVSPVFRARQTAAQGMGGKNVLCWHGYTVCCYSSSVANFEHVCSSSQTRRGNQAESVWRDGGKMEGKMGVILRATDISYSVDKRGASRVFRPGKNDIFPFCEARCGAWLESSCPLYSILNRIIFNSLRPEFVLCYFYPTSNADRKMWTNNQKRFFVNFFLDLLGTRPFFPSYHVNGSF